VKNKTSFLLSSFLVALSVTCCTLLTKDVRAEQSFKSHEDKVKAGLVLSCSDFSRGIEDCSRSYETVVSPITKSHTDLDYVLVEKFQSIVTKVSFKYLFALQFHQKKDEYLFLDLRKLLI
jgi:hypothetical protein